MVWREYEEVKADMYTDKAGEVTREKTVTCCPKQCNARSTVKDATNQVTRASVEAVQPLLKEHFSQLENRVREGDRLGFHKYLSGMDAEGKESKIFTVHQGPERYSAAGLSLHPGAPSKMV